MAASILDSISIPTPCPVAWDSMRGDNRSRYCHNCRQNVFNLSAMTREEADALVREKSGHVCVRFYRRPDGTVITRNCRGAGGWLRRNSAKFGLVTLAAAAAVFGWMLFDQDEFHRYDNWFRRTQPFATLLEWLDPTPMILMGTPAPPPFSPDASPASSDQ